MITPRAQAAIQLGLKKNTPLVESNKWLFTSHEMADIERALGEVYFKKRDEAAVLEQAADTGGNDFISEKQCRIIAADHREYAERLVSLLERIRSHRSD